LASLAEWLGKLKEGMTARSRGKKRHQKMVCLKKKKKKAVVK